MLATGGKRPPPSFRVLFGVAEADALVIFPMASGVVETTGGLIVVVVAWWTSKSAATDGGILSCTLCFLSSRSVELAGRFCRGERTVGGGTLKKLMGNGAK